MVFGELVKAYTLNDGVAKVGFFVEESGDKDVIQVGNDFHNLAYREPADYDANGPNGTYCRAHHTA